MGSGGLWGPMATESRILPTTVPVIPRRYPLLLGALTAAFASRVAGQLLTTIADVGFLPPFERWYSGAVPYPVLLPLQLALIIVMLTIVRDFARGRGYFTILSARSGCIIKRLSYLYALVMVVRYAVTMVLHPELRWFTGTLPIWFHFVLAAFLFVLGYFNEHRVDVTDGKRAP